VITCTIIGLDLELDSLSYRVGWQVCDGIGLKSWIVVDFSCMYLYVLSIDPVVSKNGVAC